MWVMKLNFLKYIPDRGAERLREDKRSRWSFTVVSREWID